MRQIKFRAWDGRHIFLVDLLDLNSNRAWEYYNFHDNYGGEHTDFGNNEKGVIMQSTGLTDKNGKDVFEGDIVKIEVVGVGIQECEVKYDDYEQRFMANYGGSRIKLSNYCEVISNIYENPTSTITNTPNSI